MPGSSLDLGALPSLDDVEFVERLGDGLGTGRFKARLGSGETVALLLEDATLVDRTRFGDWGRALGGLDHPGLPGMVRAEDALQPAFVAFDYIDGTNLEARLAIRGEGLAELDALSLVLQAAAAIRAAHAADVAHGELDPRSIVLVDRPGGLDGVVVVGWTPATGGATFEERARSDLKALGNLLYVALTGVEPPSRQRLDVDGLEGGGGAFDDILMDWVDVERDLGGLGRPALDALADSGRYADVAAFVDALLPHFRAKVESHLDEAGKALDADRAFMTEVERQRARLRELEARQRALRDWLSSHAARIERCDVELDRLRERVRALQSLETEMGLLTGRASRPAARLPDRFVEFDPRRAAWSEPPAGIEPAVPDIDRRGLDRVSRIDDRPPAEPSPLEKLAASRARLDDPPARRVPSRSAPAARVEPEPIDLVGAEPVEAIEPETVEPAVADEPRDTRRVDLDDDGARTGGTLIGALGVAVVLGVLGAAWAVMGTGAGPESPAESPAVKASGVTPGVGRTTDAPPAAEPKAAETPVKPVEAPVKPAEAPVEPAGAVEAPVVAPGDSAAAPEVPAAPGDSAAAPPADGADQPPVEDETFAPIDLAEPAAPADIGPPPEGMVAVSAGLVRPGLAPAQRTVAMTLCRQDLDDYPRRWCDERLADTIEPVAAARPVAALFVDRLEVDQKAYKACVSAGTCAPLKLHWDLGDQPATGATRDMAAAYCAWRGARLPTVDEWIYIARGDTDRLFPWGDEAPGKGKTARSNYGRFTHKGGLPDRADRNKYAATVDAFDDRGESPFGVRQLAGNVREWTATEMDGQGITMGGGWREARFEQRITRLARTPLDTARNDLGFRCVMDPGERK